MNNSRQLGVAGIVGVVLVVLGGMLLVERIFGDLFHPLFVALNAVGWPLVLIGIGVVLLNRRGSATAPGQPATPGDGLRRSRSNRVIGGVLGGMANQIGVDAGILRVVFAVFAVLSGIWAGAILYLLALVLIPEEAGLTGATYGSAPSAPSIPAPPVSAPPVPPSTDAAVG